MRPASISEADRLAALRALDIVGTPREAHFDAVCRTAQALYRVPVAIVSLVDEHRLWFKACRGLDLEAIPRTVGLCCDAIGADRVHVVGDATADPRLRDHPLVRERGLRFYAGAPLVLRPGLRIGTVCVLDAAPRAFSMQARRQLRDLAEIVIAHLRLHEARVVCEAEIARRRDGEAALGEANRLLRMAEQMAQVGHWHIDPATQARTWSDEVFRIYGLAPRGRTPAASEILALYHPEDRARVAAAIRQGKRAGESYDVEARVLRPNGETRTVLIRGTSDAGPPGVAPSAFGTVMDVTGIRSTQERLRETGALLTTTLDTMDQGLLMLDAAGVVQICNARACELLDLPPAMMQARPRYASVVAHQLRRQEFAASGESGPSAAFVEQWLASGTPPSARVYERERPDGTVLEIRTVPLPDGGAVRTYTDITERRRAEQALHEQTALLNVTLENMDQGLMMMDVDGVVRVCNARACELLDLPPAMMQAQPTLAAVRAYQRERGEFARAEAEERRWLEDSPFGTGALHYERERPNGTVLEIRTVILPDGSAVRTYTDVTERKQAERRLEALTDTLPQMVWVARGEDGTTVYANRRFRDTFGEGGRTRAERVAAHHRDDRVRALRESDEARASGGTFETEVRWPGLDGSQRWHKIVLAPVGQRDGAPEWLGTALDIEDIVSAREALRVSEERLALALEAGSDGLWDHDVVDGRVWYSDRWQTMLGYAAGELEPSRRTWEHLVHPEDRSKAAERLAAHLAGDAPLYECEHRLRRKDGSWAWVLARGKVVAHDAAGRPLRIVGTHVDIDDRKAAEARVAHMARHDALTDLPNRALFRERLDQRLAEVRRHGGICAVLCLDLDRFKAVNDTLGHLAGDVLLREVAERLRMVLRTEDTAARLGGDEFAVLLGGPVGRAQAVQLAERLIAAVSEPVALGRQQVEVGLSVGLAFAPEHGADSEAVLRRADAALYLAKAEGRGICRVFEADMDVAAAERREMERDLRHAIEGGELELHYQPQVRSATGELTGFEALVRWTHPSRGPIAPATFIPLAEETGLIGPLGEWVLRTACREAAAWQRPLKVAVNLSPRQFVRGDLVESVLVILTETGLPPARLELEITETVIINDLDQALGVLHRLKALGLAVAMDDFGTGYSSLATLQAFPFDTIKIDRTFVRGMGASPQAAAIVRAILSLGRSLGMGVVAEGVETAEQLRFLVDADCDEVQGYLIGRPQPIAAFARALRGTAASARRASVA